MFGVKRCIAPSSCLARRCTPLFTGSSWNGCQNRQDKLSDIDSVYRKAYEEPIVSFPTHCISQIQHRLYSTSGSNSRKEPEEPVYRKPRWMFNATYPYILRYGLSLITEGKALERAQIKTFGFIKGVVAAFLSVNNMLAENGDDFDDLMTVELAEKLRQGTNFKSQTMGAIQKLEEIDIFAVSLAKLRVYHDKRNNLLNVEVMVRFTFQKNWSDMGLGRRTAAGFQFANLGFLRTMGDAPEDVSDWLLNSMYYYTINERFSSQKQ